MKLLYEELRKIPRGTKFPELANKLPRDAINDHIGGGFINSFDQVEMSRGFGWLVHESGNAKFLFRGGVCERFEVAVMKERAVFHQSIINENVIFSKPKDARNVVNNNNAK